MPAAYAHYVFGQKVLRELPRDLQERIKDYLPFTISACTGPIFCFIMSRCTPTSEPAGNEDAQ